VKPTVGLPLFLGAVALIAILVHVAIMTQTELFSTYWPY
jgi:light-harvesting protein B-800-850 alpha chain